MPRFFDPCSITSCPFPTAPHNHSTTAAEWAEKCRDHMALPATGIAGTLCLNCAEQYARQQVAAVLAAHRAVVRELAEILENALVGRLWVDAARKALARSLVQQAREEKT